MARSRSLLRAGDIVDIDLGTPVGSEAGFRRPCVVVASNEFLDTASNVVMVVPLTSTIRNYFAEIVIEPDAENGLATPSAAQCQHVRSVAEHRIVDIGGRLDVELLYAIRFTIGDLLDLD